MPPLAGTVFGMDRLAMLPTGIEKLFFLDIIG